MWAGVRVCAHILHIVRINKKEQQTAPPTHSNKKYNFFYREAELRTEN